VFCYSNSTRVDDVTERLRGEADHWRSLVGLSDEAAASLVTSDGIDLLIDLSGHTGATACRCSPADPHRCRSVGSVISEQPALPPWIMFWRPFRRTGKFSARFRRNHMAPSNSYFCFSPPDLIVRFSRLRWTEARRSRSVTSTTTQDFLVSHHTMVPHPPTRARFKAPAENREPRRRRARGRIFDQFAANGITGERLSLEGGSPRSELLAAYNRVDVALDPMPYGGGTTTAEALWMGVPVVTLRARHGSGGSAKASSRRSFTELVAETPEEYVEIAVRLAADVSRLRALRSELRPGSKHRPSATERALHAIWNTRSAECGKSGAPAERRKSTIASSARVFVSPRITVY